FVLRGQPILALVRSQVRFAKKRSTCRGEMVWVRIFSTRLQAKDSSKLIAGDLSGSIAGR
ncbi:MAG TPA: hypothetical protein VF294_18090, partial [Polyangiaceae bacterium]